MSDKFDTAGNGLAYKPGDTRPPEFDVRVPDYGPSRPAEMANIGYAGFGNKRYLEGYAAKILGDLTLVAELYNGHKIAIFMVDTTTRCPKCTNLATGEKLVSNCPVCQGTGYASKWKNIGDYWCLVDFGPTFDMATPYGNTENPNGNKESVIVLGAPLLLDQSLIIFRENREIYKIYDVKPHIIAMRGDVIAQIARCSRLTPGLPEYKLIDW